MFQIWCFFMSRHKVVRLIWSSRAVAIARGRAIELADLPEELVEPRQPDPHVAAADGSVAAARERAERRQGKRSESGG